MCVFLFWSMSNLFLKKEKKAKGDWKYRTSLSSFSSFPPKCFTVSSFNHQHNKSGFFLRLVCGAFKVSIGCVCVDWLWVEELSLSFFFLLKTWCGSFSSLSSLFLFFVFSSFSCCSEKVSPRRQISFLLFWRPFVDLFEKKIPGLHRELL